MNRTPNHHPLRLRRSVLSVPAINVRALAKSAALDCDVVLFDLGFRPAGEGRSARRTHRAFFDARPVIRAPSMSSASTRSTGRTVFSTSSGAGLHADAVVLPKVSEPQDLLTVADWLAEAGADDDRDWGRASGR